MLVYKYSSTNLVTFFFSILELLFNKKKLSSIVYDETMRIFMPYLIGFIPLTS